MYSSKLYLSLLFFFITSLINFSFSQNGDEDFLFHKYTGPNGMIRDVTLQNDGKLLLLGYFSYFNSNQSNGISRIFQDGNVDNSFNCGNGFTNTVGLTYLRKIILQPNNKIIVGGSFDAFNYSSSKNLVRLHEDGQKDFSFNSNLPNNFDVNSIALQQDGKIIVGGGYPNSIKRLNEDGTIDNNFIPYQLNVSGAIRSIVVQPDGKILVGGNFSYIGGSYIIRLNEDGSRDMTFTQDPNVSQVFNITLRDDGKLLVGTINKILLLNSDGTLNSGFTTISTNSNVESICQQLDGKFIAVGDFTTINLQVKNRIARFNIDGSIDTGFNIGNGYNNLVTDCQPLLNGKFVVVGLFLSYNFDNAGYINSINSDGSQFWALNVAAGINQAIRTSSIQNDNKIILGGDFTLYDDVSRNRIVRIKPDGYLDFTFDPGTGADQTILATSIQTDQKIIIGGNFTQYNGVSRSRIARINSNGSLDLTFNVGSGANNIVKTSAIQTDDKIIIGGDFTSYNGNSQGHIARINLDGSIDPTFVTGLGFNGSVHSILIQSDGKILVCGSFNQFNNIYCPRICRLNVDGSLDLSFQSTGGYANTSIDCMALQSDGKIVIGGHFYSFYNTSNEKIARLNADGTADVTFTPNASIYNYPISLLIQPDGKVIIGGSSISRINSNGTNDINFPYLTSTLFAIHTLQLNSANNALLFGNFSLSAPFKIGTGRLKTASPIYSTQSITACDSLTWLNGITYTSSVNNVSYTYTDIFGADSIITLNLTITQSINITDSYNVCDSLTWIDGNTYYSNNNTATYFIPNPAGCDSIITLNLTIIPSQPLILENSFSLPSDANNCIGQAAISVSGNADFELNVDNGLQIVPTSGYNVLSNLCPGVHDLKITDNCGDTLHSPLVIPVDSNYVYNNPYLDSIAVDSLGATISNCTIYYNSIDTAYIDSIWSVGNVVNVIWNIVDATGSNYDTITYNLNNGNGVYLLQLNVFCPTKSLGDYFTVTEAIYFENGSVYVTGIDEKELNHIAIQPNPSNDYVTITSANEDIKQIVIFDLYGKELQNEVQDGSNYSISLNDLPTGIYLFKIKTTKGEVTKRVVKQ